MGFIKRRRNSTYDSQNQNSESLSWRKVALRGAIELYKACFVIGSVPSIPARS